MTRYTSDMSYKVTLELSEDQARIVQSALDLYTRLGLGQIEAIDRFLNWETRNEWEGLLNEVKTAGTGFPPNASMGIGHADLAERFKIAYETQCVLRNAQAWHENPEGGNTVDFYEPLKLSKHPLAQCNITQAP